MAREFNCPMCGWHGHPFFELVDCTLDNGQKWGKLAAKCGGKTCAYMDPILTAADFNEGLAVDKSGNPIESDHVAKPMAPVPLAKTNGTTIRQPVQRTPVGAPEAFDVIARMKERRDYLEMELARLDALKLEHRKLSKMLALAQREEAKERLAMTDRLTLAMASAQHAGDA